MINSPLPTTLPLITPVLLCGGSGTRLWPVSRQHYPKQFTKLMSEQSLFQASAQRLAGSQFGAPLVITNADFRFIVAEQLALTGIDPSAILIEPTGRNTAPATLAAALWLEQQNPDALMLVAPSDHEIPDTQAFNQVLSAGIPAAQAGKLVTFGITPSHAETGYGYLELKDEPDAETSSPIELTGFVEKPNIAHAQKMITSGKYLWNAGIFLFSVKTILTAFRQHAADLVPFVVSAIREGTSDLDFFRLAPTPWSQAEDISLDYAVMEHASNLVSIPYAAGWSDLGDWESVRRETEDSLGNSVFGNVTNLECSDSLLRSENDSLALVGIGLKDIIAVATPDAVLVADRKCTQEVKSAVNILKDRGIRQATQFTRDHRPWGWFESLAMGNRFQVKRIVVHPNASLSLQSHVHRSEHWIVVEGTAKVTIGDKVQLIGENQSVYVPLGVKHRLENPGKLPMTLIEVQTGSYLGEDDIVRYDDIYQR
jgi:mannose-1-phosphate guanylyltransferase/mannose-6-phosphate isomerase